MSDTVSTPRVNIRASRYWIACGFTPCPHCHAATAVFALGVPPGHETLEVDSSADDPAAPDLWQEVSTYALLFHVIDLPAAVQASLRALTDRFRPADDAGTPSDWANHCERCGAALDDQELFCEPGVFLPNSEAAGRCVEFRAVHAPFEAAAAGYALDPQFFTAMEY